MYYGLRQRTRHEIRCELLQKMEQRKTSTNPVEISMLDQIIQSLEKEALKAPEDNR